ncbi:hypothetical protein EW145_g5864 [Phellinidium pouzarii]|uniref:Endonuclease/exonuclease/phosphatase domain-containing protein n=1 Tax=Phellinidium pouzarii TaxID=167371 RepID=A0A4S4L0C7_9AGAM|nr:hypothetical protein EW145_g5864 [Phellinidium pouzarii]
MSRSFFQLMSHNVARSPESFLSLLEYYANNNNPPNFLLFQEPLFYSVGVTPSLDEENGVHVYGFPRALGYHMFMLVYTSYSFASTNKDILTITISTNDNLFFITNIYNNVRDPNHSAETFLPHIPINPNANWCIAGDFNHHSPRWSPPSFGAHNFHGSDRLHQWMDKNNITIVNKLSEPTRRGIGRHVTDRHSVIDLVLVSTPLEDLGVRDNLEISFNLPTASDHAVIQWEIPFESAIPAEDLCPSRLNPYKEEEFTNILNPLLRKAFSIQASDTRSLDKKVDKVTSAFKAVHAHVAPPTNKSTK